MSAYTRIDPHEAESIENLRVLNNSALGQGAEIAFHFGLALITTLNGIGREMADGLDKIGEELAKARRGTR